MSDQPVSQITAAELTDTQLPLTTERQTARLLSATYRTALLLHEQLERFAADMVAAKDGIQRGHLMSQTEFMLGVTARLQGLHHEGARTLTLVRNDGRRRVEVHHQVSRAEAA